MVQFKLNMFRLSNDTTDEIAELLWISVYPMRVTINHSQDNGPKLVTFFLVKAN